MKTFPEFATKIPLMDDLDKMDRLLARQSQKLLPFRYDGPTFHTERWILKSFEVELGIQQLRYVRDGGRGMAPGKYHRLIRIEPTSRRGKNRYKLVMTDTDAELIDFIEDMRDVEGKVLVGGLGMGLVIKAMLWTGRVASITVVEIDKDLIRHIEPYVHQMASKHDVPVTIEQGDIRAWNPGSHKFDFMWFDIWDTINDDNLGEMNRLRKRFQTALVKGGTMKFWCEHQCQLMRQGVDPRHW